MTDSTLGLRHILELQVKAGNALRDHLFTTVTWWERIWTVQEAVIPENADILWGPLTTPWAILSAAFDNYTSRWARIIMDKFDISRNIGNIGAPSAMVRGISIARRGESLLDVLVHWRYRRAKDPRDKIYALFGIFRHAYGITDSLPSVRSTDYTSDVSILYTKITKDLLRICSPMIEP